MQIAKRLNDEGWRVAQRFDSGLEWWADEIWAVESVWTPQEARAYLTFLIDPQYETFGRSVWALGVTTSMPHARGDAESGGTFLLRHGWEAQLSSLVDFLAALRTR